MANKANVRVECKNFNPHAHPEDRMREFKRMHTVFKRLVSVNGVLYEYKEHQHYESKSRKRRRKKREAELARLKDKLKENFIDRK